MNILQIISSGGMYGAESVILNLSRELNSGGHRSALGVFDNLSNPNRQLHERAMRDGIDCHLIPCKGQIDHGAISRIRNLAIQTHADVVHAHGYKADVYSYLALRKTTVGLVSTCHNWLDENILVCLYGIFDRRILRHFGCVVAVSDDVKHRLLQADVPHKRIRVIRNGIDVRPFGTIAPLRREGDAFVIGLVGRLSPEKGIDVFIRAASEVSVNFPNAEFVVVGEGPSRNDLQKLVDDLKIGCRFSLAGRRDGMLAVYRSFDVMVSSSRAEGLPIALLEGMASGLPIIATAVGEVPSIIHDGQTGLLLPPEGPHALASAIMMLLADGESRKRLGGAARQLIEEEYSSERMAAEYLRAYEEAITQTSIKPARRLHRGVRGEST